MPHTIIMLLVLQVRHAGDMGNILAGEDGVARVDLWLKEELAALLNRCGGAVISIQPSD